MLLPGLLGRPPNVATFICQATGVVNIEKAGRASHSAKGTIHWLEDGTKIRIIGYDEIHRFIVRTLEGSMH